MIEQLQELIENMQAKEIAAKQLKIQAIGKGDERSYDIYNISAELCGYFAEKLQEILQAQKPDKDTPPQLNKHDVIGSYSAVAEHLCWANADFNDKCMICGRENCR